MSDISTLHLVQLLIVYGATQNLINVCFEYLFVSRRRWIMTFSHSKSHKTLGVVNIRNISMLLKVHSFRKTEIKPILFFEPIVQEDFIRAELVVVRKLVILSCTVTLWPGLVKCRHQHVYRQSETRAKTVTNTWPDPCSVTNNDQPSANVYFVWREGAEGNYSFIPSAEWVGGVTCMWTVPSLLSVFSIQ